MEYIDGKPILVRNNCSSENNYALGYMKVEYLQEPDNTEDKDNAPDQKLIIETRSDWGLWINIKTGPNGWSINADKKTLHKELTCLIEDFIDRFTMNSKDVE